jgi:hypothetical protein
LGCRNWEAEAAYITDPFPLKAKAARDSALPLFIHKEQLFSKPRHAAFFFFASFLRSRWYAASRLSSSAFGTVLRVLLYQYDSRE